MAFLRGKANFETLYTNAKNIIQKLSSDNMRESANELIDIGEMIAGMDISRDKKDRYSQLLLSGQSSAGSNIRKIYSDLSRHFSNACAEFKQSLSVNSQVDQQPSITYRPGG
jgi:hypothetical protein